MPNEGVRHVLTNYYPDMVNDEVLGFFAHVIDITEQNNAQTELQHMNELLYNLFDESPAAIAISNLHDGKWRDVNKTFLELFEFESKEELIGKTAAESNILHHPEQRAEIAQMLKEDKIVKNYETQVKTKTLKNKWLSSTVRIIEIDKTPYMLAVSIDITKQKKAQEALLKSEEKYRNLINLSPAGITLSTVQGEILEANQAILDILGYESNEEFKNVPALDLYVDKHERKKLIEQFNKEAIVKNYEIQLKKKNGALVWINNFLMPLNLPDGEIVLLSTSINITDAKEISNQLIVKNEKIEEQNNRLMNFSNIVSHNLKSYSINLASILDLYKDAELEVEKQELFDYLQSISKGFASTVSHLNEIVKSQNLSKTISEPINLYEYIEKSKITLLVQINKNKCYNQKQC